MRVLTAQLGKWRGLPLIIDPNPCCAATYVNDVFGPDRSHDAKARLRPQQNVKFRILADGSGFPHAFWEVISPIPPGQLLLGDYGDSFWAAGPPAQPAEGESEWQQLREGLVLSALMRRLMNALRGRSATFPISCDGSGGSES